MSKYKISEHVDEIKTNIISNICWYAISFLFGNICLWIPLIKGIYDLIVKKTQHIPTYAFSLAGISIILLILLIVILIFLLAHSYSINNTAKQPSDEETETIDEHSDLSLDYKFRSIIAEMTFDDNRMDITSTIDYKMTVLSEEVTELKRQLIWSGSEYQGTKLIQMNGNYSIEDSTRTSSPYPYTIKFNDKKKRGDTIEFKTETSVVDGNLSMLPMYSFMVKYQIDVLVLQIIAPKGMLKNVQKVVYADSAREICVEHPTELCGENIRDLVRYTFKIKNPTLLYHYFIEWEFTNS